VKVDMVLIRNVCYSIHGTDHRNVLFGLMHAGIPAVNSLVSEYMQLERPLMFGALRSVQKRLGADRFPLIEQNYYSSWSEMKFTPNYPIVVKVGHTHAGFGKIRVPDHHQLEDLGSVLALHGDYAVAEPFLKGVYDLRIQKIGDRIRCYKRIGFNSWKTNTGAADLEEIPIKEEYRLWVDECSKLFGGLDMLAVDAIHDETTDKDYILELNGTSIGLGPDREPEDNRLIAEVVLTRMRKEWLKTPLTHDVDTEAKYNGGGATESDKRLRELELANLNLQNERGAATHELEEVKRKLATTETDHKTQLDELNQHLLGLQRRIGNSSLNGVKHYFTRNPLVFIGLLLVVVAGVAQWILSVSSSRSNFDSATLLRS